MLICDLYFDFRYDFCDLAQAVDSRHTEYLGPIIWQFIRWYNEEVKYVIQHHHLEGNCSI